MVGPTVNPEDFPDLFNRTLFTKKDFPVLYFPTMETIPNFLSLGNDLR